MGNTYSFFQTTATNSESLTKFKIQKIPTFEEISEELNSAISSELLDDVFERCCFMTVDTFFDDYRSDDTLKCQYSPKHIDWFFTCKTCCLADNSCICATCFLSGNHIELEHQFTIFESPATAVCDCGNPEAIKVEGFCHSHRKVDEASQKARLDRMPFFVKKDIHIFFRYLFRYLQKITTSTVELSKEREEDINIINDWLCTLCGESSILIHIIAEELTSRCLDSKDFKLYDLKRLPYENASDTFQQRMESHHFLGFIFSRMNILELFVPLLTLLLDNHNVFKLALFEEYLKNYILIFTPRDSRSSRLMQNLGSYYMDNMKILVPFSTGFSRYNFIELVLRAHKNIYMPLLLPFYQTDKKIEKEVMLQSDLSSFSRLMKNPTVVKFLVKDEEKYRLYFEFSETLHGFTSPQFVDPSITTTKFLVLLEHRLMNAMRNLLKSIDGEKDPELIDQVRDITLKRMAESIGHIKKRPLYERCGFKMPHADFFQKFTYNEIPIHFALYRVVSFFFLHTKMDPSILMTKYGVKEDEIVDMFTTLLLFRVCYVSYDPTDSLENCTDFSMITDLHLMQISLCLLGPKKFLYTFFNVMSSVDTNASSSAFSDTFALLISVLQLRGTLDPTKEYIQFNLYQALFSGIFFKLHFRSFDTILYGITEGDICDIYLPEISKPGNHAKELKDLEMWKYYDPYYPCFSIVYKNVIKNNTKERFKRYQISTKKEESNPLPPELPPISSELLAVNNIYDDPTFFEMIFTVLLDFLYPEYIGYDNSFELQPILKILIQKPEIVLNEFIYLLVLGVKTFKDDTYPSLDQLTKDQINQSIKEYFESDDKISFKFQKHYTILNLLNVHNVELSIGQKKQLSLLQVLYEFWYSMTNESKYLELRPSILYIFKYITEFHPSISNYFKENSIDLEKDLETSNKDEIYRKKLMAEKREKVLEQMKKQQQSFLSNFIYGEQEEEEEKEEEKEKEEVEKEEVEKEEEVEKKENVLEIEEEKEEKEEDNEEEKLIKKSVEKVVRFKDDQEEEKSNIEPVITESEVSIEEQQKEKISKERVFHINGNIDVSEDEEEQDDETVTEDSYTDEHEHENEHEHEDSYTDEHEHDQDNEDYEDHEDYQDEIDDNDNKIKEQSKTKPRRKIEFSAEEISEFEPCVICKTGERGGRLFSMAYVDLSGANTQNKLEINFRQECKEGLDQTYKDFLHTFATEDIKIGVSQFIPYEDDPSSLFSCYLFNRSPSTYVSSCHHNVHKKCIDNYIRDQKKLDDLITAFKCPLCSRACDIIIPLGKSDESKEYKEDAKNLFTELFFYDFATVMDPQNKYSIDRYLWKFVLQNIETLELKSRKTSLYSDKPYFIVSETDFQKELLTTANLFRVIDTVVPKPESTLPFLGEALFYTDPFVSSTYTGFLSKQDRSHVVFSGIFYYIFSVFIHHVIESNLIPNDKINDTNQVSKIIESEYRKLFNGKPFENEELRKKFINQIHPYLRKILIHSYISTYFEDGSNFPFESITLENLANFDLCLKTFKFESMEAMLAYGLTENSFNSLLKEYLEKTKISEDIKGFPQVLCIYPPPCNYELMPSFTSIPNKYIDFMKRYIKSGNCPKCKSLLKLVCLFCGKACCPTPQCTHGVYSHIIGCPAYPLGLFQHIENPHLQVYVMEYGTFRKNNVVSHIFLDKNGSKPNVPGVNIFLSNKKLKKLYKHWIDNNNSRKFLK